MSDVLHKYPYIHFKEPIGRPYASNLFKTALLFIASKVFEKFIRSWRYNTKQEEQLMDLYSNISTSASRWFYYKSLFWNFKHWRVQRENVSYCFTVKQWMSSHVSLYENMLFFDFPITTSKLGYSIEFPLIV